MFVATHHLIAHLLLGVVATTPLLLVGEQFPQHTIDVTLDFSPKTSRSRWINGFLPKYTRGTPPTVWMIDRQGKTILQETALDFPDVVRVEIKTVTADLAGNLYASAEVWSGGKAATGAICRFAPNSSQALVIRTDDFVAVSLAVTDKGDIWAFGLPLLLQTSRTSTAEYATLLHLSASGKLLHSLLPRSGFGENIIPTHAYGNVGDPFVWATKDRIGVYSALARRWVEFDITTSQKVLDFVIETPLAADGTRAAIGELVMTTSNNVFAAFHYPHSDKVHAPGVFWLDKSSRSWLASQPGGKSAEYQLLTGGDGDSLVFRAGSRSFGWFSSDVVTPAIR